MKPLILGAMLMAVMFVGCTSYEQWAATRTEQLRAIYPAGTTSRADVQAKWGKVSPDFSYERPAGGWKANANPYLAEKLQRIEQSTQKEIFRVEQYWGPDGLMSLCYCWFYYDAGEMVVDVEWQYKSD